MTRIKTQKIAYKVIKGFDMIFRINYKNVVMSRFLKEIMRKYRSCIKYAIKEPANIEIDILKVAIFVQEMSLFL